MKKNFTINMFGMLFNIDEDAYQLLENYLQNMRDYFSRREGGEEITDDIEHRITELLAEQKAAGVEAVTIEHIQDIIHRLGNPQEMDSEAEEGAEGTMQQTPPPVPQPETAARRKLFRDGKDKMLGGVLSGISRYFGINDTLVLRLVFIVLCFVSFSTLAIVYIILWILMPEARTAEERLLMCGKPVTRQSLNEEIMRGVDNANNYIFDPENRNKARGCLNTLLSIMVNCIKIVAVLTLLGIFLGTLVFLVSVIIGLVSIGIGAPLYFFEGTPFGEGLEMTTALGWWSIGLAVSGLTLTFIPLYVLVRSFFARKDADNDSRRSKWGMLATWFVALVATIITTMGFGFTLARCLTVVREKENKEYVKENTRNGMFLSEGSWDFLEDSGWKIVELQNAETHIVDLCNSMESMLDDVVSEEEAYMEYLSLIQKDKSEPMRYKAEKTLEATPGRYRIAGFVNTDGQGNALYARQGDNVLASTDIKAYSATEPILSHNTCEFVFRRPATAAMDSILTEQKWMPFEMEVNVPATGELKYGFTNEKDIANTPWTATRLKVYCLRIERMEDAQDISGNKK